MDIKSLTSDELTEYIVGIGEKKFRADQIFKWLHERKVQKVEEMSNISGKLKEDLIKNTNLTVLNPVDIKTSKDGTKKYLFELSDKKCIESVLMEYEYGSCICISTQVGCEMGCVFCASGAFGCERSLSASEIIEQLYSVSRIENKRISRVVFMGMGEPLVNYENVKTAIKILTDKNGQDLSVRHITLSTCGIVPGIIKLADDNLGITLAISLHSAIQENREKIMPIAKKYSLDELIKACDYYRKKTGRRITFEYCLIKGDNDTDIDVDAIYKIMKNTDAHLNVIPVHKVKSVHSKIPGEALDFKKRLEKKGINVTIRRELGADIDGACGQLMLNHSKGDFIGLQNTY